MKNKTSKYFKYAIGEIILVMIGILLALQVNNWNEDRKVRNNEIVLLEKLQEENTVNLKSIEGYVEYRQKIPKTLENFIELLETNDIKSIEDTIKDYILEILQSSTHTFAQSNLINYINTHNFENSNLSKELVTLEFYQNDLEIVSDKGLEVKLNNIFQALENDIDFNSLEIASYSTLKSLKFKNKLILLSSIEDEISFQFNQTYKQMIKVDSLITERLKL